jgi:hypothetical protein
MECAGRGGGRWGGRWGGSDGPGAAAKVAIKKHDAGCASVPCAGDDLHP